MNSKECRTPRFTQAVKPVVLHVFLAAGSQHAAGVQLNLPAESSSSGSLQGKLDLDIQKVWLTTILLEFNAIQSYQDSELSWTPSLVTSMVGRDAELLCV